MKETPPGMCPHCGEALGYSPMGEYCSKGCGYVDGHYWPKAAPPVGAPQKETPPISEEVAAWRNLYPSAEFASVTKGAQGKEPQTPEEWIDANYPVAAPKFKAALDRAFSSGEAAGRRSAITELQEWILTVREDPFDPWSAGYNKGYDAVSKKCAELQEKTK